MKEKFVIYFGFPSTPEQIENVEKFASNQSIEDAWVDLLHTFIRDFRPNDDHESFIDSRFSYVYGFTVIPPPFIQQKYPRSLGKTTFRLPCLAFMDDYVTAKETGERIKITDVALEELCNQFQLFIDTKYARYEWCN
jgi:hypothetical protein